MTTTGALTSGTSHLTVGPGLRHLFKNEFPDPILGPEELDKLLLLSCKVRLKDYPKLEIEGKKVWVSRFCTVSRKWLRGFCTLVNKRETADIVLINKNSYRYNFQSQRNISKMKRWKEFEEECNYALSSDNVSSVQSYQDFLLKGKMDWIKAKPFINSLEQKEISGYLNLVDCSDIEMAFDVYKFIHKKGLFHNHAKMNRDRLFKQRLTLLQTMFGTSYILPQPKSAPVDWQNLPF